MADVTRISARWALACIAMIGMFSNEHPFPALTVGAVIASLGAFVIYHLYSYSAVFLFHSTDIQLTANFRNVMAWLNKHQQKEDAPSVTLAIQTLRNTILVAIFVGGNSFQFAFTLLNALLPNASLENQMRTLILAACLFSSFLCWASVIRSASHLGYMIGSLEIYKKELSELNRLADIPHPTCGGDGVSMNTPEEKSVEDGVAQPKHKRPVLTITDTPEYLDCARMLKVMLTSFSLGFRFLFVSIPFAFFVFGPVILLISSAVILGFLIFIDHSDLIPAGTVSSYKTQ